MGSKSPRSRSSVNGDDVRSEIIRRIVGGLWQAGERLPSCRQIAAEFGSNANTVNRELQRLASEGVVRSEPRRGTYVTGSSTLAILSTTLQDQVDELARRALAIGTNRDDLIALIDESFAKAHEPSIAFAECNVTDLHQMTELIVNATGVEMKPILIDDLARRDSAVAFELIATPLFHLGEVLDVIDDDDRIVELNFTASSKTLREIAALSSERVITVAAPTESGAERIAGLLRTVFRGTVNELVPPSGDAGALDEVDVLVYVNAMQLGLAQLDRAQQVIRIDWQLDGTSADHLRTRVLALREATGSRAS